MYLPADFFRRPLRRSAYPNGLVVAFSQAVQVANTNVDWGISMHIVYHPLCTSTISAPDDIQDESRARLPVMRQTDAHGQWITSFWKPSAEELESIITGGGVALHIRALAHQHPLVSVATWQAIDPELVGGDPFIKRSTSMGGGQMLADAGIGAAQDAGGGRRSGRRDRRIRRWSAERHLPTWPG